MNKHRIRCNLKAFQVNYHAQLHCSTMRHGRNWFCSLFGEVNECINGNIWQWQFHLCLEQWRSIYMMKQTVTNVTSNQMNGTEAREPHIRIRWSKARAEEEERRKAADEMKKSGCSNRNIAYLARSLHYLAKTERTCGIFTLFVLIHMHLWRKNTQQSMFRPIRMQIEHNRCQYVIRNWLISSILAPFLSATEIAESKVSNNSTDTDGKARIESQKDLRQSNYTKILCENIHELNANEWMGDLMVYLAV